MENLVCDLKNALDLNLKLNNNNNNKVGFINNKNDYKRGESLTKSKSLKRSSESRTASAAATVEHRISATSSRDKKRSNCCSTATTTTNKILIKKERRRHSRHNTNETNKPRRHHQHHHRNNSQHTQQLKSNKRKVIECNQYRFKSSLISQNNVQQKQIMKVIIAAAAAAAITNTTQQQQQQTTTTATTMGASKSSQIDFNKLTFSSNTTDTGGFSSSSNPIGIKSLNDLVRIKTSLNSTSNVLPSTGSTAINMQQSNSSSQSTIRFGDNKTNRKTSAKNTKKIFKVQKTYRFRNYRLRCIRLRQSAIKKRRQQRHRHHHGNSHSHRRDHNHHHHHHQIKKSKLDVSSTGVVSLTKSSQPINQPSTLTTTTTPKQGFCLFKSCNSFSGSFSSSGSSGGGSSSRSNEIVGHHGCADLTNTKNLNSSSNSTDSTTTPSDYSNLSDETTTSSVFSTTSSTTNSQTSASLNSTSTSDNEFDSSSLVECFKSTKFLNNSSDQKEDSDLSCRSKRKRMGKNCSNASLICAQSVSAAVAAVAAVAYKKKSKLKKSISLMKTKFKKKCLNKRVKSLSTSMTTTAAVATSSLMNGLGTSGSTTAAAAASASIMIRPSSSIALKKKRKLLTIMNKSSLSGTNCSCRECLKQIDCIRPSRFDSNLKTKQLKSNVSISTTSAPGSGAGTVPAPQTSTKSDDYFTFNNKRKRFREDEEDFNKKKLQTEMNCSPPTPTTPSSSSSLQTTTPLPSAPPITSPSSATATIKEETNEEIESTESNTSSIDELSNSAAFKQTNAASLENNYLNEAASRSSATIAKFYLSDDKEDEDEDDEDEENDDDDGENDDADDDEDDEDDDDDDDDDGYKTRANLDDREADDEQSDWPANETSSKPVENSLVKIFSNNLINNKKSSTGDAIENCIRPFRSSSDSSTLLNERCEFRVIPWWTNDNDDLDTNFELQQQQNTTRNSIDISSSSLLFNVDSNNKKKQIKTNYERLNQLESDNNNGSTRCKEIESLFNEAYDLMSLESKKIYQNKVNSQTKSTRFNRKQRFSSLASDSMKIATKSATSIDSLLLKSQTIDGEPIPETNIGNKMLQQMGWKPGTSLGPTQTESTENKNLINPIVAVKRPNRLGLGFNAPVSHSSSNPIQNPNTISNITTTTINSNSNNSINQDFSL